MESRLLQTFYIVSNSSPAPDGSPVVPDLGVSLSSPIPNINVFTSSLLTLGWSNVITFVSACVSVVLVVQIVKAFRKG